MNDEHDNAIIDKQVLEDLAIPKQDDTAAPVARSPIYGSGDPGFGDVRRRRIVVLVELPKYLKDKDHPEKGEDFILQGQMLDHDIREAMAVAARRLNDNAMKYGVTGYAWNLDDIEYDIPVARVVMCSLVLTRE